MQSDFHMYNTRWLLVIRTMDCCFSTELIIFQENKIDVMHADDLTPLVSLFICLLQVMSHVWTHFGLVMPFRTIDLGQHWKPGICFHHYCAVYKECKYSDTFWLADRTRLFVQYTISSSSSLCKLIWRHWTYKMPVIYFLSSVWVRLSIISPLSIIQYLGLYVFSLPISVVMIESIYFVLLSSSSNRKYELLPIV